LPGRGCFIFGHYWPRLGVDHPIIICSILRANVGG
jgi:hypothetical protein